MVSEKDICKAIIALGKAADAIDDGYHNVMIGEIVKLRNALSKELSDETNRKLSTWYENRTLGGKIEEA